ncbi:MAG: transcriptional regulator, partial [Staphylococcus epidermidis]|nr:transcriptional regulator [Staphylococcus epidermidis]
TMSHYYSQEHQIILDFYKDKNITDVLADILQEG